MAGLSTLDERSKTGIPLSLVILRYFGYVLISIALSSLFLFGIFSLALNMELIYPADYGRKNIDEITDNIQTSGHFDEDLIPSPYYWIIISQDGSLVEADMPEGLQEQVLNSNNDENTSMFEDASLFYEVIDLNDGSTLVLCCEILPQFVSKSLRDLLPNPEFVFIAATFCLFICATVLIAIRASRVLRKKMVALEDAAQCIAQQNLDFAIERGNVREINAIIDSMENMKTSLKESLETQWKIKQAQEHQIAALVHDLNTPLTIVKGNAGLLCESTSPEESEEYLQYLSQGIEDIAMYIQNLMVLSQASHVQNVRLENVETAGFIAQVELKAKALGNAVGVAVDIRQSKVPVSMFIDEGLFLRAMINIISNAIDHSPRGETVNCVSECLPENDGYLKITILDRGEGFSERDLKHATEEFYQAEASRKRSGHYGIGLTIADSLIKQHGGSLVLSNQTDRGGGAQVSILLPVNQVKMASSES